MYEDLPRDMFNPYRWDPKGKLPLGTLVIPFGPKLEAVSCKTLQMVGSEIIEIGAARGS